MEERELEDLIFDMENEWVLQFEKGNYEKAWKLCMKAWDLLPEPKYKQSMSWFVVVDIVKYGIETNNFEYAEKFLGLLFINDLDRIDSGEREFWAGRLAYEKGYQDIAKELFTLSLEKSQGFGIITQKENQVYRKLVQGNEKTAKSKNKLSADKLIDKADKAFMKKNYKDAEEFYLQGLDKISELKGDNVERYYRNVYAGLGDCCFLKEEYKKAKDYYFNAYNYDFSNPYINMRIGECFVFLHNEDNAKEYLMKAYLMAGEAIFKGNEPFLSIIKDLI